MSATTSVEAWVVASNLKPDKTAPVCNDADTAVPGFMKTKPGTVNLPISGTGGFIQTLNYDGTAKVQMFIAWAASDARIYVRKHTSGSSGSYWSDWKQLAFATS